MAQGDVCQIALVERHRATGWGDQRLRPASDLSTGKMAMASTVAHDSHHMIVVGTDRAQMAKAANRLAEVGGGVTVFREGAGTGAGRTAHRRADVRQPRGRRCRQSRPRWSSAMEDCGCTLNNAYMQHSLLALVVIPELRISDKGLIDVRQVQGNGPVRATWICD